MHRSYRPTRRDFLTGSLALALGGGASAKALAAGEQAEWQQNYESAARVRVTRSSTPILSPQSLAATEEAIAKYRDIVARGGWAQLQAGERLRVGAKSPAVVALRQRLIATGDLDPAAGTSPVYDSYVEAGVRRFQARHGLNTTAAMNSATLAAMNVPAETRLRQLEINAVRLRSYSGNLGNRYVIVNIPAALVEMGYLHHARSRVDRRSVRISLTEKGKEVHEIIHGLYDKHARTIEPIGGINPDDFQRLNQSLVRLERFWTDQIRYRL
jgi:hypothetical protein